MVECNVIENTRSYYLFIVMKTLGTLIVEQGFSGGGVPVAVPCAILTLCASEGLWLGRTAGALQCSGYAAGHQVDRRHARAQPPHIAVSSFLGPAPHHGPATSYEGMRVSGLPSRHDLTTATPCATSMRAGGEGLERQI
jgi:hypothetical protein